MEITFKMTLVILSLQEKACLPTHDSSHDSKSSIHYLGGVPAAAVVDRVGRVVGVLQVVRRRGHQEGEEVRRAQQQEEEEAARR